MSSRPASTLSSQTHERLRHDIVRGELPAGSKLKMTGLMARYGVGLSPLREALARLCGEQLVIGQDQRGFRVAPLSLQELDDIAQVRNVVVNEAMNASILRGDAAWEVDLRQALQELGEIEQGLSNSARMPPPRLDELERCNHRFHCALLAACGSPWLLKLQDMFYHQAERYRYAALPGAEDKRFSYDEHQAICEAALQRNVIKACRLHEEHMSRTHLSVRAGLKTLLGAPTVAVAPARAAPTGSAVAIEH